MKDLLGQPTDGPLGSSSPSMTSAPSGSSSSKSFDLLDLKQYFHIVVKRIWLVALCFVLALGVMVVILVRQVPVYSAEARLLLSRGLPIPSQLREREVQSLQGADYITTQQQIIRSSELIQRAQERTGRTGAEISEKIKKIDVYNINKTSMLGIKVESLDPVLGAEFSNAIAEEYLNFKAEQRMGTSRATVLSLTQQANRIREELEREEEALLAFERENNIVAIEERGNIAAKYLARLSNQAAEYRTERMMLEAQQPMLQDASDEAVLEALGSPTGYQMMARPTITSFSSDAPTDVGAVVAQGPEALIDRGLVSAGGWADIKRQKAMLEAELAQLRKLYRDSHPEVQRVLNQIQEADRSLDVELQFALGQYYSKLESLRIKEQAVRKAELSWEDEAIQDARTGNDYRSIKRSVGRLRSLYDLVFNRLKEVDISIGIEPESVTIIKRATPASSPVNKRKGQSIFMAAIVGLGIGLGLVFALEFIDDSLRYPEEVTDGLGLNFFGVIPAANWDPEDLRSHMLSNIDQKSGLSEAYRNVRSSLLFVIKQTDAKAIVVSSAVPKEGKTTTCLNLAVSLAQAGSRVLMVDGDLRRGELHKFFGLEGGRGFSDVLIGQAKPESVVQRTGIPNLDLIATGPFPPNPAEIMLRPELSLFLDYSKRTYDYVLFDCPPVMAVSESAILASSVDGAIFVVWAGQTSKKLSGMAVKILKERGANVLGCVLNNLEFARVGYYYYSTYYGYYDYDYRYESAEPDSRQVG